MSQTDPPHHPKAPKGKIRTKWRPLLLGWITGLLVGLVFMGVTRLYASGGVEIEDVPERFAALLEERDPLGRVSAVARLFSEITPEKVSVSDTDIISEIRLAFETSSQLYDGDVEFALLGAWWARLDPEAAYQWTRTSPRGASRRVLVAVFDEWGAQDPLAAVLVARDEKSELRRQAAFAAALTGANRAILPESTDLVSILEEIPNRVDRRIALQALITLQARRETPAELLARAAGSREERSEDLMEDWFSATAMVVAMDHPAQAAEFLSMLTQSSGTLPPGVVKSVASSWSADDPAATLEWLSRLGPNEERSDAVRSTYRHWLGQDRAFAIDWAAQRAENPDAWFDPIRANYAFILGLKKPREGLRLLFMLPIDDERALYVQEVFARWNATDPDDAEAWLQQADLPRFRKEQLQRARSPLRFPRKPPLKSNSNGAAES